MFNDVWISNDIGLTWSKLGNAGYSPRAGFRMVVTKGLNPINSGGNSITAIGGIDSNKVQINEIWFNYDSPCSSTPAYVYRGCYKDSQTPRSFPTILIKAGATSSSCFSTVGTSFKYFGTQYGGECWSGSNEIDKFNLGLSSGCTTPCSSNPVEFCGGSTTNSVYEIIKSRLTGADGSCTCANGLYGDVTYINGIAGGCSSNTPVCEADGNCINTPNCCAYGTLCYRKNEYFASCYLPSGPSACTPGIHAIDPPQWQTPWSCEPSFATTTTRTTSTTASFLGTTTTASTVMPNGQTDNSIAIGCVIGCKTLYIAIGCAVGAAFLFGVVGGLYAYKYHRFNTRFRRPSALETKTFSKV